MKAFIVAIGCAVVFGVVGFLVYENLHYRSAYALRTMEAERAYGSISALALRYGTIRSVDSSARTLTIETKNSYEKDGEQLLLQIKIKPDAYIARQELMSTGGVYTGVSSTTLLTPGDLTGLAPGARIKFLVTTQDSSSAISYLVFGNPL